MHRQKRVGSTWSAVKAGHGFWASFGVDGSASARILAGGGQREEKGGGGAACAAVSRVSVDFNCYLAALLYERDVASNEALAQLAGA